MESLRSRRSSVARQNAVAATRLIRAIRTAGSIALVAGGLTIISAIRVKAQNAAPASKPAEAPAGNAENGKKIFVKYGCYECHGRQAQGSMLLGPRLGPDPLPVEALVAYVRKPTGEMPPYSDKVVSDQELADIHAFLESLPHPPAAKTIPILK